MKKTIKMLLASLLLLVGCGTTAEESGQSSSEQETNSTIQEIDSTIQENNSTIVESVGNKEEDMQIRIVDKQGNEILFQLNDSSASKTLYEQLPLSVEIENYSDNEKIFYPPEPLDTSDTPLAKGPKGILTYYEPWEDVAIFYDECTGASGLYMLGETISGEEQIESLSGEVEIEQVKKEVEGQ